MSDTREIALASGERTLVSEEDYDLVSSLKWFRHWTKTTNTSYARAYGGKDQKQICMHRLILQAPSGIYVDHINHNGLDNRRENLRLATRGQNSGNARPRTNKISKFKGVTWDRGSSRWRARIRSNNQLHCLGRYASEEAAAIAYDAAALKYFGEFAYLNFPDQSKKDPAA